MITSVMKMNFAKDCESNEINVLQFCSNKIISLSEGPKENKCSTSSS